MKSVAGHDWEGGARSAYTLVEATLAIAISTLLAAAMASSILVASRGLQVTSGAVSHTSTSDALTDLMTELRHATSVAKTPTSLTVTVGDQTGDGQSETIVYSWSSAPGGPLTRSFNGSAASVVVDAVETVSFEHWGTVDPPTTPAGVPAVVSSHTNGTSTSNENINLLGIQGQYFVPSLPGSAQNWTPTKVRICGRNTTGASGTIAVEIQTVNGLGYPTGNILVGGTLDVSAWGASYDWREVIYTGGPSLPPTQPFCVVVKKMTATGTVHVQSDSASGAKDMLTSSLGGITWSRLSTKALRHEVHGTYVGAPTSSGIVYLNWLQLKLTRSSAPNVTMVHSVDLLNRPAGSGF